MDRRSHHLLKPGPVGTQPLQAVDLDLVPSSCSLELYQPGAYGSLDDAPTRNRMIGPPRHQSTQPLGGHRYR